MLLENSGPDLTKRNILDFENRIDLRLSESYKKFLLTNNGGTPIKYMSVIDIPGAMFRSTDLQFFLTLELSENRSDLLSKYRFSKEKWPWISVVPIAYDGGGNYFCLFENDGVANHVVYIELHAYGLHMYHVADDFDEFVGKIYID